MATVPMRYIVELAYQEWIDHPFRKEWMSQPIPFVVFFKQYNINVIHYDTTAVSDRWLVIEFESETDYILWQLYQ